MSICDQGSDTLAWVCRWSKGFRSASSPPIHIFAGENVCIHATTPMHSSDRVRVETGPPDRVGRGQHRRQTSAVADSRPASVSAICARLVLDLAQRLLPVQRLAAGEEPDLDVVVLAGMRISSCPTPGHVRLRPLAVDVLVAVVQVVDVVRAIGTGSPSCRAMCTLRATSSHITAALTAALGSLPIVNTPWLRISTARRAVPGQGLHDALADVVVADQRERADRDLAAELVGHRGEHAGDWLGPGRPRAARTSSACARRHPHPACAGRRRRARRCRWTGEGRPRPRQPSRSQTIMLSGVSSS